MELLVSLGELFPVSICCSFCCRVGLPDQAMALLWLLSVWLLISGTQGESCPLGNVPNKILQGYSTLLCGSSPSFAECYPARCPMSQEPLPCQSLVIPDDGGVWALGLP